jgi:acyl-CoA thioester hydrolase
MTPDDFPHLLEIQTRWNDNDVYGHVNNVVYYAYFDTVINRFLVEEGGLDIDRGAVIGVCVESQCAYKHSIAFPDTIAAGLRVEKLGTSSVRYAIGIFHGQVLCAQGSFVHVFVDRATRRPAPIPPPIREALARIAPGATK